MRIGPSSLHSLFLCCELAIGLIHYLGVACTSQFAKSSNSRMEPQISSSPYPLAIAARYIWQDRDVRGTGTFSSAAESIISCISFSSHLTENRGSKSRLKTSGAFKETRPDLA